jgi:hypothetical protein
VCVGSAPPALTLQYGTPPGTFPSLFIPPSCTPPLADALPRHGKLTIFASHTSHGPASHHAAALVVPMTSADFVGKPALSALAMQRARRYYFATTWTLHLTPFPEYDVADASTAL